MQDNHVAEAGGRPLQQGAMHEPTAEIATASIPLNAFRSNRRRWHQLFVDVVQTNAFPIPHHHHVLDTIQSLMRATAISSEHVLQNLAPPLSFALFLLHSSGLHLPQGTSLSRPFKQKLVLTQKRLRDPIRSDAVDVDTCIMPQLRHVPPPNFHGLYSWEMHLQANVQRGLRQDRIACELGCLATRGHTMCIIAMRSCTPNSQHSLTPETNAKKKQQNKEHKTICAHSVCTT